jgi:pimeloyl-ACP methyl ester carboxylesterase
MTIAHHTVSLDGVGPVDVTVTGHGRGRPFLLLHGGAGPASVTGFAERFASAKDVQVLVPTNPGFDGTERPAQLRDIPGLARLYVGLVEQLDLADVTVMGNSIGGWIAAEIGLIANPRISRIVLVDAVGIEVPGHPVADFFSLTMDEVVTLSFHDSDRFRVNPATLAPAAQAVAASNRQALSVYAGASMADPSLAGRLSEMQTACLVVWGDSDRIVDPDYGRAYAAAIPAARFQLLADTGHLPQLESPEQLIDVIWGRGEVRTSADHS